MTDQIQGVVTLIRSAIKDETLALPLSFSLEEVEPLLNSQSLLPMAFQGALKCGYLSADPLMQRLRKQYLQILMRSERQLQALRRLLKAFEAAGIDHMPVKGSILKELYPAPEMRIMCDADILIRTEQYERIREIMQSLQYEPGQEEVDDFVWKSQALYLELHKRLFGRKQRDLFRYFGSGWEKAIRREGCRYEMSVEDTYLYIFCHMTKHFRWYGVGARQIVDLYVFRRAHPQMDEKQIGLALEKLHLKAFHDNILRVLRVWFDGEEPDAVTEQITAYVFSAGSWGTEKNALYAETVLHMETSGAAVSARSRTLLAQLFPPKEPMQQNYNILYRLPWLYPVFWPVRWVDVLLHRRKNIARKLGVIQGISAEKADAHRRALQSMGLDFRCIQMEED